MNKNYPEVVKIIYNDDGDKVENPVWHYVEDHGDAARTLCGGEVFGYGEGSAVYKEKVGKITCQSCISILKKHKEVRL